MNIAKLLVFGFLMFQGFLGLLLYLVGAQQSTSSESSSSLVEGSSSDPFFLGSIVAVFVLVFALRIFRTKWIHGSNSEGVLFGHWIILLVVSELPGILGFVYAIVQQKTAALSAKETLFTAVPFVVISIVSFLMLLPHAHKVIMPKGQRS